MTSETSAQIQTLVERLRKGDDDALGPFIEATQRHAFRLARSLLRDDDMCKDVVQDAYLIVYQEVAHLRDVRAFRTWFSRIILNRCRRVLRERPTESLDVLMEVGKGPAVAGEQSRVDEREDLKRALATLTEIDRSVLMLREVMQLSYDEIATTLEVPVGTVRSRLSEARRRLVDAWHGGRPSGSVKRTASGSVEERQSVRNRANPSLRGWSWAFGFWKRLRSLLGSPDWPSVAGSFRWIRQGSGYEAIA